MDDKKARVFLVSRSTRLNVDGAKRWGDIIPLLDNPPSPFKTDEFVIAIRDALERHSFDPDRDLFCLTGQVLNLCFAVAVVAADPRCKGRPIKVLLFDAAAQQYFERLFDVSIGAPSEVQCVECGAKIIVPPDERPLEPRCYDCGSARHTDRIQSRTG